MKLAAKELQSALYSRLSLLEWDLYDYVPENAEFPYVTFAEPISTDNGDKECPGEQTTFTFNFWDSQGQIGGSNNNLYAMSDAYTQSITTSKDKISEQNFITLSSFHVIRQDYDGFNVLPEFNSVRHGVLRVIFWTQEKE